MKAKILFTFALLISIHEICSLEEDIPKFRKVIVPSVYKEWKNGMPKWVVNESMKEYYGYETFIYQKHSPSKLNYIGINQGNEAGVYLRYIVDHYHNFPDVAVFVHAKPQGHNHEWLKWVRCIRPNASYLTINHADYVFIKDRSTTYWGDKALWIEQCWRDVLKITWNLTTSELNIKVPISAPMKVSTQCCQQFIMGRADVLRRPLDVWRKLLKIIGEQYQCHAGELDYDNLYSYHSASNKDDIRRSTVGIRLDNRTEGFHIQGGTMEHLAHVVYGNSLSLTGTRPTPEDYCNNFLPDCNHSPCKGTKKIISDSG